MRWSDAAARFGGVTVAAGLAAWLAIALGSQGGSLPWVFQGANGVLAVVGPLAAATVAAWSWRRHVTPRLPQLLLLRSVLALVLSLSNLLSAPTLERRGGHGVGFVVFSFTLPLTLAVSAWLVLAWPAGRLTGTERRLVMGVAGLALLTGGGSTVLADYIYGNGARNPVQVADLPSLEYALATAFNSVLRPGTWFLVVALLIRRERGRDPGARGLLRPGVVGLVAGFPLLEMIEWFGFTHLLPWMFVETGGSFEPTVLAWVVNLADANRLGLVVGAVGLGIGLRRLERAVGEHRTDAGTVVDVTEADRLRGLVPILAHNLGDPSAGARFRTPDGAWVDGDGNPLGDVGPDRVLTAVAHGSEVIAAVEFDEALRASPSVVEAAVAATGLLLEHQRLEALARIRLRELGRTRVALVEAGDAALVRLERDLHDGAQQRLVALAFEAGLVERGAADPERRREALRALRRGIEDARSDLLRVASGLAPALLAERGLGAALAALARSCPVPLTVEGEIDDLVAAEIRTAIWFAVNEAVTNAVKHADAGAIVVRLRTDRAAVTAQVTDDGRGGADLSAGSGLRGLRDRMTSIGGHLDVGPAPGGGTQVAVRIPFGAIV